MGGPANTTFFTNDTGSLSGAVSYVVDAFQDITLAPTSNAGFSTSLSKNPLSKNLINSDQPQYGPKTLFIKDLILVSDRTLWISNKPTYQIVWTESWPSIVGYAFGDIQIIESPGPDRKNQKYLQFMSTGDGIGLSGVIQRAQVIVNASAGTGNLRVFVDGVSGNTIDYSNSPAAELTVLNNKITGFVHASSNETRDIHDIRFVSNIGSSPGGPILFTGVVVYEQNTSGNIDLFPGTTYVSKNKTVTSSGSTLALPSLGSSLGAKSVIFKNASGSYALSTPGITALSTVASGSTGTNLITVTTGTGASFQAGNGFVAYFGGTAYLGSVLSVSTDTLTVGPTLTGGVSGPLYRTWFASPSYVISNTGFTLAYSIGASQIQAYNGSYLTEPKGDYWLWSSSVGVSLLTTGQTSVTVNVNPYPCLTFQGSAGFLQVDGYFSAAEVEYAVNGTSGFLNHTAYVNGYFGYTQPVLGITGLLRQTIMCEAGPGWNSIQIQPGATFTGVGISKINLYQRARDYTVSGQLAEFDTLQSWASPKTISATTVSLGTYKRYFADQFTLQGPWTRALDTTAPGGVVYSASGSSCSYHFEFYGDNFAQIGTGGSVAITLDGASFSQSYNVAQTVATLGFHTLIGTIPGATTRLSAIDIHRPTSELKNLQNYNPLGPFDGSFLSDSSIDGNLKIRNNTITRDKMKSRILTFDGSDPGIGGIAGSSLISHFETSILAFAIVASVALTCTGNNPVRVWTDVGSGLTISRFQLSSAGTNQNGYTEFTRNGAVIYLSKQTIGTAIVLSIPTTACSVMDFFPVAGLNTYTFQMGTDASNNFSVDNMRLMAMEMI